MNQTCASYKVGRRTRRWPQAIFFRIMDIAGVNANILYNSANPESNMSHQKFLINLGQVLIRDQLVRRAQMVNIPRELKELIRRVGNIPEEVHDGPRERAPKRARCYICPRTDNKHSIICTKCNKHICKNHCVATFRCSRCMD